MSAAHQPAPVSVLDGKYALLRELGSGGTGTVYEAENLLVGKKIALKLMNPGAFAERESQARFVAEARAAARIAHANVVDIHDLDFFLRGHASDVCLQHAFKLAHELTVGVACGLQILIRPGDREGHEVGGLIDLRYPAA